MSKVTDLYGSMVFNEHVMRERLPKATYKQLMKTIKEGAPLERGRGQRRRPRHEGVGHREGRHPLHPLVPAADRHHRREARQLHRPHRRRQRHHGPSPARSSSRASPTPPASPPAACAPPSRPAATPPGIPPPTPSSRTSVALHPHGLLLLQRRGARQEDAASALHGGHRDRRAAACLHLFGNDGCPIA